MELEIAVLPFRATSRRFCDVGSENMVRSCEEYSLLGSDPVYRATGRMCRVIERMLKRSAVRAKRQLPRFTRMARQPITTVRAIFREGPLLARSGHSQTIDVG
jgi:hypothetical protein